MRIVSWNVQGDLNEEVGEARFQELTQIVNAWDQAGDPVTIVCLQEVNAEEGMLAKTFTAEGWAYYYGHEQAGGRGRSSMIAVRPDAGIGVVEFKTIDLQEFRDPKGITSSPVRTPFKLSIDLDGVEVDIITWHATLGSRQIEDFVGLSKWIDKYIPAEKPVIIAADFNQTEDAISGPYYCDFDGFSHHLDHILARNIVLDDGQNSSTSSSDHLPISAHFELMKEE